MLCLLVFSYVRTQTGIYSDFIISPGLLRVGAVMDCIICS